MIDFGAQSTKIGVARNKGIDIVRIACPTTFLFLFLLPLFLLFISIASGRTCVDYVLFCILDYQ